METKKKKFEFPNVLALLVFLVIFAAILTYIVPAGMYDRALNEANGYTVVVPGSYHPIEQQPVNFLDIPGLLFDSFDKASDIIAFVFIVGGAFAVIMATGALDAFCISAAKKFAGKEKLLIIGLMFVFSILGSAAGMSTEGVAFIPMAIALCAALGYDRLTAISIVMVGALTGYTAGAVNPFSTGIAQILAELPMFSGLAYRIVVHFILFTIAAFFTVRYAEGVRKNPKNSILIGEAEYTSEGSELDTTNSKMTGNQLAVLFIVLAGFVVLVYGALKLGWWLSEMAGLFLSLGVICGLVGKLSINELCERFTEGAGTLVSGALMIGFARGIQMVMDSGAIIDTIVYNLSNLVMLLPPILQSAGVFILQSFLNIIMTSSNVQVVVTMPILIPVGDLVGVSRQATVLAFQLGDGFSNILLPTWSTLMSILAVAKITYQKWVQYAWKIMVGWTLAGVVIMMVATVIGY